MRIDTSVRTQQSEIMDDFDMAGNTLRRTLDEIAWINKLLGGNHITLNGVKRLLRKAHRSQTIHIVDFGCGSGDMLRMLAIYARRYNWIFELHGIDANADAIAYARELSRAHQNISYTCLNLFDPESAQLDYDIALCTLTLHHFSNEEILQVLRVQQQKARLGIVVNDLERSTLACRLFQALSWLLRMGDMPRNDGLVSIMRGFKRSDLEVFSKQLSLKKYRIRWKWAFRYQWIIEKL